MTNKTVCRILFISNLLLFTWQFIEAVFVTFVIIVFVFFVDKLSIKIKITSHLSTEVSATLF